MLAMRDLERILYQQPEITSACDTLVSPSQPLASSSTSRIVHIRNLPFKMECNCCKLCKQSFYELQCRRALLWVDPVDIGISSIAATNFHFHFSRRKLVAMIRSSETKGSIRSFRRKPDHMLRRSRRIHNSLLVLVTRICLPSARRTAASRYRAR